MALPETGAMALVMISVKPWRPEELERGLRRGVPRRPARDQVVSVQVQHGARAEERVLLSTSSVLSIGSS